MVVSKEWIWLIKVKVTVTSTVPYSSCNISGTLGGNFITSSRNVHLDLWINWLEWAYRRVCQLQLDCGVKLIFVFSDFNEHKMKWFPPLVDTVIQSERQSSVQKKAVWTTKHETKHATHHTGKLKPVWRSFARTFYSDLQCLDGLVMWLVWILRTCIHTIVTE